MTDVVCDMENCIYRSKRPLRKYRKKNGEKCYRCALEAVRISRIYDPDGDAYYLLGEESMAICAYYKPIESEQEEGAETDE